MADASYPDDLLYHPEHDWVRIDGDTATFGITWFAQDALGEVVFFDLPEVGTEFEIDVRGKNRQAAVATRPLYSKENDG